MTNGFHRDSKRFTEENCKACQSQCCGTVVYLGADLKESGVVPDADPRLFYFADVCPLRIPKEGSE